MLARRICNSSFMAVKAGKDISFYEITKSSLSNACFLARIQSQVRLLNVSAIALREEKPVMDQGVSDDFNEFCISLRSDLCALPEIRPLARIRSLWNSWKVWLFCEWILGNVNRIAMFIHRNFRHWCLIHGNIPETVYPSSGWQWDSRSDIQIWMIWGVDPCPRTREGGRWSFDHSFDDIWLSWEIKILFPPLKDFVF